MHQVVDPWCQGLGHHCLECMSYSLDQHKQKKPAETDRGAGAGVGKCALKEEKLPLGYQSGPLVRCDKSREGCVGPGALWVHSLASGLVLGKTTAQGLVAGRGLALGRS